MSATPKSDSPRTDAASRGADFYTSDQPAFAVVVPVEFARSLERELSEVTRQQKQMGNTDSTTDQGGGANIDHEVMGMVMPKYLHPATKGLVLKFANALADKLQAAEEKYGYDDGWLAKDWMDECRAKLVEHVAKGDPRDVAAYCAFLWWHGESTAGFISNRAKCQLAQIVLNVEAALLVTHRRDHLFRNAPPCPECQADQVQCTDCQVVPSEWKCRECRHRFLFEPAAGTATTLPTNEHDCVAAERELEALRGNLAELVACKDLQDSIVKLDDPMNWKEPPELAAMQDEYNRREPLAWEAARAALSVGQQG